MLMDIQKEKKTIKLLLIFLIFIYCYGGSRWMCIQHGQCREWWGYTLHLVLLQSQLRTAGFSARLMLKDEDAQSIKGNGEESELQALVTSCHLSVCLVLMFSWMTCYCSSSEDKGHIYCSAKLLYNSTKSSKECIRETENHIQILAE